MYAVTTTSTVDKDAMPTEQRGELEQRIIPTVRQMPGFVSGYWTYDVRLALALESPVRRANHIVLDLSTTSVTQLGVSSAASAWR